MLATLPTHWPGFKFFSIKTTRAPSSAARPAAIIPPAPAPREHLPQGQPQLGRLMPRLNIRQAPILRREGRQLGRTRHEENAQRPMEETRQFLHLSQCWLTLTLFPRFDAFFLHLKPLGNPVRGIAALLACPREKRRIDCYGLIARHDEENLTGNLRSGQPSRKCLLEDGLAEARGALEVGGHHRLLLQQRVPAETFGDGR